ncbi:hypothetical protein DY000_02002204 [Brassica cretica]|uniref:Transmembrane protein n=1 Tax=Brassica cretica TaxID=69181 RepID=A0ABQ7CDJ3_BRACR|nr:hypothetical protein DY000_02002204 [Brassica cretica]
MWIEQEDSDLRVHLWSYLSRWSWAVWLVSVVGESYWIRASDISPFNLVPKESSLHLSIRVLPIHGVFADLISPRWHLLGCLKKFNDVEVLVQSDEDAVLLEGFAQVFRFFVVLVSVVGVVLFCVFWLFIVDGRVQVSFCFGLYVLLLALLAGGVA